jgi:hypothetical protein
MVRVETAAGADCSARELSPEGGFLAAGAVVAG